MAPAGRDESQVERAIKSDAGYWSALNKVTLVGTAAFISAGYAKKSQYLRAAGFGLYSLLSAEKAVEDLQYKERRESAATNATKVVGTAAWAAGIALGSQALQAAGPGVNAVANAASVVSKVIRHEEGWLGKAARDAIDMSEMLLFSIAGGTGSTELRSAAFGAMTLGFFFDGMQDKNFLGHGSGSLIWGIGAGLRNDALQSFGAGIIAAAETVRLVYPAHEKYVGQAPSNSATALQPVQGPVLPVYNSATTTRSASGTQLGNTPSSHTGERAHDPALSPDLPSVIPLATAANQFAPPHYEVRRSRSDNELVPHSGRGLNTGAPVRKRGHSL
ncbi:hypothetical protein [Streptomyces sp. NRRL S-813]|uniref:hypothetical protein n=1 Tax=Streptomyces sp. NRRL S-813 TaxID=1463919 RepID=UPI00131B23D5|nr:hypothetical protein [Streptomyces sp. NRRL S-813]